MPLPLLLWLSSMQLIPPQPSKVEPKKVEYNHQPVPVRRLYVNARSASYKLQGEAKGGAFSGTFVIWVILNLKVLNPLVAN